MRNFLHSKNLFAPYSPFPHLRLLTVISGIAITSLAVSPDKAWSAQQAMANCEDKTKCVNEQTDAPLGVKEEVDSTNGLLGDMWGLRTNLSQHGLTLTLQETSETLGNVTGGTQKGFTYDGLTQATLQMDTQRAFGHYGGLFNLSALQIHGTNLSTRHLQSLQTSSGITANPGFRLWELWYDQKFLEQDQLDVKIGQQSVDQEFIVSSNALMFVNTMFGWPMLPSADLPGGGPAYPLSALGVRFRAQPMNGVTVLAGVFNGSPAKNNEGDSQEQNPHGVSFPLGGGTLSMLELQFSSPETGSKATADQSSPPGWTYRLGAWYNSQQFSDQRFDSNGLSLANPNSTGQPLQHHGNFSYYAVADHLVWRDSTELDRTLAVFARVMATPSANRNLIYSSLNLGTVLHAPFPSRTDDSLGFGMGYARVSGQASDLDRDTNYYSGQSIPVRGSEYFAELTYQYQMYPWLQLQPDVQYIINPGGGVDNPNAPGQKIKNELVLGLRVNIAF